MLRLELYTIFLNLAPYTKMLMIVIFLPIIFVGVGVDASYCGQAAVPFSLEVLASGHTVLGCARPACFGWTPAGARSADPAQFYRIGKHADGFFRATDVKGPVVKNASGFQPQYSICDRSYLSAKCSGASWVGGIAPTTKIDSSEALKLMCCYYNKLTNATETGSVEVRAGQIVEGGEIRNELGRTNSFEYIANVQRLFGRKGEVIYVATMKKFACVPEPPAAMVVEENEAKNFLIENIMQSSTKPPTPPTSLKSFAEQTFDIPHTMPQEDAPNANFQKSLVLPGRQSASANVNSRGVPIAKSMDDELDEEEKKGYAYNTQVQLQQKQQQQNHAAMFAAPITSNSIVDAENNYNYKQQQSKTEQQQQAQTQPQSQYYNRQQEVQQNMLMNPFGLFSNAQWFVPQQPQQSNYYNNYAAHTTQQQQPLQQQQQLFQQQQQPLQQQSYAPLNLAPTFPSFPQPQPLQLLSPGPVTTTKRNFVDSATSNFPAQPLLQIPTPEEIENAIPASSRQLIANMARTFLGYFN